MAADNAADERDSRLVGDLYICAETKALREATRALISPLVERAPVSRDLKDAALSAPPQGIMPEELPGFTPEEISETAAGFIESGALKVNARGAYELTAAVDPGINEALKYATGILRDAGWTEEQAAPILAVFEGEDKEPDYDDDDDEDEDEEGDK